MIYKKIIWIALIIVLLIGCKAIPPITTAPDPYKSPKDIVVLIDGTANTPSDNTNINKLRKLKKDRDDLVTFYTVGVGGGLDAKISGMALGVGVSKDVIEAYQFICEHYNGKNKDKIYLFGFSRGAYTAQILSNLIYTTGLLELDNISTNKEKKKLIRKIYKAYLGDMTYTERKVEVKDALQKWKWKNKTTINVIDNVSIEVMGLFDNVEALAAPDYKEKFCAPNSNHLNQFVNIKKVLHAVSLDDNRAQIFTPILATCSNIKVNQNSTLNNVVNEVWFSGSHSDVGGGYSDDYEISYISLNWMINELEAYNLFNNVTISDMHTYGGIHDSEDNIIGFFYKRRNRDIPLYLNETGPYYNNSKLKIHQSVIDRLKKGLIPQFKLSKKYNKDWFDQKPFDKCFKKEGEKRIYNEQNCNSIEVIDYNINTYTKF